MALTKDDLKEIGKLLDTKLEVTFEEFRSEFNRDIDTKLAEQRWAISRDMEAKLAPIVADIADIKRQLAQLLETETEDVQAAFGDIAALVKRVVKLEKEVAALRGTRRLTPAVN